MAPVSSTLVRTPPLPANPHQTQSAPFAFRTGAIDTHPAHPSVSCLSVHSNSHSRSHLRPHPAWSAVHGPHSHTPPKSVSALLCDDLSHSVSLFGPITNPSSTTRFNTWYCTPATMIGETKTTTRFNRSEVRNRTDDVAQSVFVSRACSAD